MVLGDLSGIARARTADPSDRVYTRERRAFLSPLLVGYTRLLARASEREPRRRYVAAILIRNALFVNRAAPRGRVNS